jgi:hypothetical protein
VEIVTKAVSFIYTHDLKKKRQFQKSADQGELGVKRTTYEKNVCWFS